MNFPFMHQINNWHQQKNKIVHLKPQKNAKAAKFHEDNGALDILLFQLIESTVNEKKNESCVESGSAGRNLAIIINRKMLAIQFICI